MPMFAPIVGSAVTLAPRAASVSILDTSALVGILSINDLLDNPLATFAIGCVTGAAICGLGVGLVSRSAYHRLEDELRDCAADAQRAEGAARRAQFTAETYKRELAREHARLVAARDELKALDTLASEDEGSWRASAEAGFVERGLGSTSDVSASQEQSRTAPPQPANADVAQAAAPEESMQGPRTVADVLREKFGANPFGEEVVATDLTGRPRTVAQRPGQAAPVQRATQAAPAKRPAQAPSAQKAAQDAPVQRAVQAAPVQRSTQRRVTDATMRAREIDRRIPRFDESLFPDLSSEQESASDSFADAMQAMEEKMPAAQINVVTAAEASGQGAVPQVAAFADTPQAEEREDVVVSYSRGNFTVIEGTGDLSAAPRVSRARHMRPVAAEA